MPNMRRTRYGWVGCALETYKTALKQKGNAKYVTHFSMHGKDGRLLYWLFFCSGSDRGLEEMKEAMWAVDSSGDFIFSDKHQDQPRLLKQFEPSWLADVLAKDFEGETVTVGDVRLYVLTETPCVKFSEALKILETGPEPRLTVPSPHAGRRRGTFANPEMSVTFKGPSFEAPSLFG